MRIAALILAAGLAMADGSPALAAMEDYPSAQLMALDKSTARTTTFDVPVGSTIQYGALYIKVQACRKADPIDKPESAAFLQVWELPPEGQDSQWVFSGWMFASSPALSAMDHPVYDVWVLNCLGKEEPVIPAASEDETPSEAQEEPKADESTPAEENGQTPETEINSPQEQVIDEEVLLD